MAFALASIVNEGVFSTEFGQRMKLLRIGGDSRVETGDRRYLRCAKI